MLFNISPLNIIFRFFLVFGNNIDATKSSVHGPQGPGGPQVAFFTYTNYPDFI